MPEPGELVGDEEKALGATILWEPITNKMTAVEFRCLVQRMLDRLKTQGYELRRPTVLKEICNECHTRAGRR